MSQDARLLLANSVYSVLATIKNGSGGAPAVNEDANRPLANIKIASRYRFWRTASAPPSSLQVDLDFGASITIKTVGVAMVRAYRGLGGFSEVKVYSGPTGAYPPTWTLRSTIAIVPATDNDKFADLASNITARYWRFEFNGVVGQFSVKPWLVKSSDVVTLTEGGAGAIENPRRVREKERATFLGGKIFNDLGIGVGERLREFRIEMPILTQAQLDAIRASQAGNFIYQHHDAAYYEVRHSEPSVRWSQHPGTTTRYRSGLAFSQVP